MVNNLIKLLFLGIINLNFAVISIEHPETPNIAQHDNPWEKLPEELKHRITLFINSGRSFDEIIANIENLAKFHTQYADIIKYLINNPKFLSIIKNQLQPTASSKWFEAILNGNIETVQRLINSGIDVNMNDKGVTALMGAAALGHKQIVEMLLQAGAAVNLKDQSKQTALLYAHSHPDIAKLLITAKADVNVQGADRNTPLRWAVDAGDLELVKLLVHNGAYTNITDSNGLIPLDLAQKKGYIEIYNFLSNNSRPLHFLPTMQVLYER